MLFAHPASAVVIGNADTNKLDYMWLATDPAFSYSNAFGSIAFDSDFRSVGQIYGRRGSSGFSASGVLIDDDWVLTAAHVTDGASSLKFWLDKGGTNFSRSSAMLANGIYTHPNWTGSLASGHDIGLFRLSAPAPCYSAGTCETAELNTTALDPSLKPLVVEIGFGRTGTGSGGATKFDGLKRGGTNILDAFYANGLNNILLADFDSGSGLDNYFGSSTPTVMEAIIAPGDSGGGLFTADGLLLGITSFIWGLDGKANSDFGDTAGWSNVATYGSWIACVIANNANCNASGTALLGAGNLLAVKEVRIAEPGSLALLGLALAGLLASRRRR